MLSIVLEKGSTHKIIVVVGIEKVTRIQQHTNDTIQESSAMNDRDQTRA